MFSKTILVFILCSFVSIYGTHPSTLNALVLQKLSCLRPTNVPVGLEFEARLTPSQCAFKVLSSDTSVAMFLDTEQNGDLSCGFSDKIPLVTPCEDSSSGLTVFYSKDRLPVCPGPCLFHYQFLGIRYCIQKSPDSKTYSDCNSYCNSVNGEMVEARTREDLNQFWDLVEGGFAIRVWFGGSDFAKAEEFRWNRGDLVNSNLFDYDQPNAPEHRCLSLQRYPPNEPRLNDLDCYDKFSCACAIICKD